MYPNEPGPPFPRDRRANTRNGGRRDHYAGSREHFDRDGSSDQRSIGELFRDLASEAQTLVYQEVQLAKTELSEKASAVGKHFGLLVGGGLVAYAGFIICLMAVGFLLGSFMPDWLAFLCAGFVVVIAGSVVLKRGLSGLQKSRMALDKTTESVGETAEWLKEESSDVKKHPVHLGSHR